MIKNVKWIFVVLTISSLISFSFIEKNKATVGLTVGDRAPAFTIGSEKQSVDLNSLKGKYVLLSFWASYDAPSREQNAILSNVASKVKNLEVVSVSFDNYKSIFNETIKQDQLTNDYCFVDVAGASSNLYKSYDLNKGFKNYLLDGNGIIVAKNINVSNLSSYMK